MIHDPPKTGLVAAIEFGATARGDADAHSDRDIFILVDDGESRAIAEAREAAAAKFKTDLSTVTCYTISTVDRMAEFGSLFLWHLRLEGRILIDQDGIAAEALAGLQPYAAFDNDVARFRAVFEDVEEAFSQSGCLNAFESHVLFGIARNTCMLLTALAGNPSFGRLTVLPKARKHYPTLPLSSSVFAVLEAGHLVYHRGAKLNWRALKGQEADAVISEIRLLLRFAAEQKAK